MSESGRVARRFRTPLRRQLLWLIATFVLTTTAIVMVLVVVIASTSLSQQLDEKLDVAVTSGLGAIFSTTESPDLDRIDIESIVLPTAGSFQALVVDGRVVSSGLLTQTYEWHLLTAAESSSLLEQIGSSEDTVTVDLRDDSFRTAVVPLDEGESDRAGAVYVVGITQEPIRTTVVRLLMAGTAAVVLAMAGAVLLAGRAVGRSLAPLNTVVEIADRVARTPMDRGEIVLGERVPEAAVNQTSEAGRVGFALNRLLDHVGAALLVRHRAEDAMGRFVAEASHELRNPLTSIRGYAEHYAASTEVSAGAREGLHRIAHESARLGVLVDELLTLAKLDAGRALRIEPVDLSRLVMETVGDTRMAFTDHDWRIELPSEPVVILGDDLALRQVVVNLLSNAGAHTPAGTRVTVRASVAPLGGTARLEVHDDGQGIGPEALPVIFDRFRQEPQSPTSRSRRAGSVGLGLSIVDAIVRASGGTIEVTSSPGSTSFVVTLPVDAAPGPTAPGTAEGS